MVVNLGEKRKYRKLKGETQDQETWKQSLGRKIHKSE